MLVYLKSLPLNHVTPEAAPEYSEDSLAHEIVKNLSKSQDLGQTAEFLSIFSLGAQITENIIMFLRDSSLSFKSANTYDHSSESESSSSIDSEVDTLSELAETESETSEDDTDQELSLSVDASGVLR